MIGKAVTHCRMTEKLCTGSGVVCKAKDTKLRRHVALAFLEMSGQASGEIRA
jgi:hypothetical protein